MRRPLLLAAALLIAGCGGADPEPVKPARAAEPQRAEPAPPDVLAPDQTWRATISSPGSLADGAFVRVSFGPLRAKGEPPAGMEPTVLWITDRSYRL